ncbi:MAG: hypothetical protein AB7G06_01800 [Bdellovibrionales bacterium]
MRNKGLHRGADEIGLIKKGILTPTQESIATLCKEIGALRLSEAACWQKRGATYDGAALEAILAEQKIIEEKLAALLAELERKLTLKRVFDHLIGHRAGEVSREFMDPKLRMELSHEEGLMLRDIEQCVVA